MQGAGGVKRRGDGGVVAFQDRGKRRLPRNLCHSCDQLVGAALFMYMFFGIAMATRKPRGKWAGLVAVLSN